MKHLLLLCAALLSLSAAAFAQNTVSYPEEKPLIDLTFPESWETTTKQGVLYAYPADDKAFFLTLAPLQASAGDKDAALKEVKAEIKELFHDVEYFKPETRQSSDIGFTVLNAKGTDEDGPAVISVWIISRKDNDTLLQLKCVSSPEAFKKHSDLAGEIFKSIAPHSGDNAAPEGQIFNYPDSDNPTFTARVPADWSIVNLQGGFRFISADKAFTATVTPMEMSAIMEATDSIGKQITSLFDDCVWNEGGKPKVTFDKDSGFSLTENTGVATDKNGKEVHLRLNQYARKGSDTFFVMSAIVHADAEEANAEGIEMLLSSIKHK